MSEYLPMITEVVDGGQHLSSVRIVDLTTCTLDGDGIPRLNPTYEAYLSERLQFDGDIPELRTGPLPEGAKPAIPVQTHVTNPAAIGMLLQQASETMLGLLSSEETCLTVYRPGEVPAPMAVPYDPQSLLHMDKDTRQKFTWAFLSTTQGRRTAVPLIEQRVNEKLGFTQRKSDLPLFEYEWVINLMENVHPSFDFIGNASSVIANAMASHGLQGSWVEIKTVDRIADRVVGWKGVLYK